MAGEENAAMAERLTHIDQHGRAHMVDVSAKAHTERRALAQCRVLSSALDEIEAARLVALLQIARVAAAQASKQTATLIPLCHPLALESLDLAFAHDPGVLVIVAEAMITAQTGVEMEALVACGIAALTVLCELVGADPEARIEDLQLLEKSGGRSGVFVRDRLGDD